MSYQCHSEYKMLFGERGNMDIRLFSGQFVDITNPLLLIQPFKYFCPCPLKKVTSKFVPFKKTFVNNTIKNNEKWSNVKIGLESVSVHIFLELQNSYSNFEHCNALVEI